MEVQIRPSRTRRGRSTSRWLACGCTRSRWAGSSSSRWLARSRRCCSGTRSSRRWCCRAKAAGNDYEERLDRDSLTFIALQQPVANDLRLARAIARIGLELERVGDEAKKIARFALHAGRRPRWRPGRRRCALPASHGGAVGAMLRKAVRAADEMDPGLARRCWSATRNSRRVCHGAASGDVVRDAGPPFPAADHRHDLCAQGARAHRRPCDEHRGAGAVHGGSGSASEADAAEPRRSSRA